MPPYLWSLVAYGSLRQALDLWAQLALKVLLVPLALLALLVLRDRLARWATTTRRMRDSVDDRQLRLKQRGTTTTAISTPTWDLTRGGVEVSTVGQVSLVYLGGLVLVAIKLVLASPPSTGAWALAVPELVTQDTQLFGQWMISGTATGSVPAKITAGVITPVGTAPEPGSGGTLTVTGVIS